MNITLIYAECRGIIGYSEGGVDKLPTHLPEDLKWFKKYTMGKTLVMGRKTVESLPVELEGRTVMCLTRQEGYVHPFADGYASNKEELLEWAGEQGIEELVIAGGADVYKLFMEDANRIVKTRINHTMIPKAEFRKMKGKVLSPDMSVKGDFDAADVLEKTNKMIVIEYIWREHNVES